MRVTSAPISSNLSNIIINYKDLINVIKYETKYNSNVICEHTITSIKELKDKIKKMYPKKVMVTKSNRSLFASNYISKHFPDCCEEKEMLFDDFLSSNNKSYYLIQGEQKIKEIPHFLEKERHSSFSSWINFGDCYTTLHYDCSNNVLMQIFGRKKIILIPPSEYKSLHLINNMDTKLLCKIKTILNL